MAIDQTILQASIDKFWDEEILPTLIDYIKIPSLSTDFDPQWQEHGYLNEAQDLAVDWLNIHTIPDWKIYHEQLEAKTPLLLIEIPGNSDKTILLYGHLDKQPEMEGWYEGYGPWKPILTEDKLFGRGGADDGYAIFATVAAIKALKQQQLSHARIVILIEFSEESGSPDLPPYLEKYKDIIGTPDLVVALDSGAGDYKRLWSTTSLRGMLSCSLTVQVLTEATHSGIASGIVPSSMRIMRLLLDRLEEAHSGKILLPELFGVIPPQRLAQTKATAHVLGDEIFNSFNTMPGLAPLNSQAGELLLNNTWRPTLSIVGQDGMPAVKDAGNVLRAYTRLKLSFRLPPNVDFKIAQQAIHKVLTKHPPYNAKISVDFDQGASGWDAPPLAPWLEQATKEASIAYYDEDPVYFGLGASIPFMSMLGAQFPQAQFLITGVLGPKSNAHGPNEFIHIPFAKKLTACVAHIIARHHELTS